jgi:hypothetical protein
MYGGNFKQYFGWYILQTSLRLGIRELKYIPDITPENLVELINECIKLVDLRNQISEESGSFSQEKFMKISEINKKVDKIHRKVNQYIENTTREEFGFRKIGEANVSETILKNIISNIFSEDKILTHHRPNWLEGLELDIFLPSRNIGIEYQGQQHFHPIKAWGGIKALQKLRERDQRKRLLCKENSVLLIEFDYTEPLEYNYIKEKIGT